MPEISMGMVIVMGLATVFVVLICLIIICKLMGVIVNSVAPAKAEPAQAAPKATPAPAADVMPQQTVAAIAAAIAENMGSDISKILILSIRRI